MTPSIIGTDVVERQVVDGVLVTHRLVSSKWYFPRWAQAVSYCFFVIKAARLRQLHFHCENYIYIVQCLYL